MASTAENATLAPRPSTFASGLGPSEGAQNDADSGAPTTSLLDLSRAQLGEVLAAWEQRPYRLKQLIKNLYQRRAESFAEMSDVPQALRERLAKAYTLVRPLIDKVELDPTGTRKYRFVSADGSAYEAVYIPEVARGRGTNTLCISSQTGCSVGCKFCFTASLKRNRNLLVSEILGQVLAVQSDVAPLGDAARVTNLVFMGMGEPLLNYDNVVAACTLLLDEEAFNFPGRRVTISTSGIVPRLKTLGAALPTQLAISLNATTDDVRTKIMPINKKWGITELLATLHAYPLRPRRRITIEYVLLGGVNDSEADAHRLVKLLHNLPNKVNLLPLNAHERTTLVPPTDEAVARFQKILLERGLNAFVRTPRGQEISAACGQLGESVPIMPPKRPKGLKLA